MAEENIRWDNADIKWDEPAKEKGMLEGALESGAAFARSAYEAIPFRKDVSAARQMARNSSAASDAPPINPPSTSGMPNNSAALAALTLPPYRIGINAATRLSRAARLARKKACTACA